MCDSAKHFLINKRIKLYSRATTEVTTELWSPPSATRLCAAGLWCTATVVVGAHQAAVVDGVLDGAAADAAAPRRRAPRRQRHSEAGVGGRHDGRRVRVVDDGETAGVC